MGGRGYRNDVKGYLNGNRRTVEFQTAYKSKDGKLDILYDKLSPTAPTMPIFSNTGGKIYAVVDKRGSSIKQIGFYDDRHILTKTIHLDHSDGAIKGWHVHDGDAYHHMSGNSRVPTAEEKAVIERILNIWKERRGE